jgi:methionyl-tRNA synthetase
VAADVLTRYRRLLGRESFFLTGTDEHGSKVEKAAESSGVSPKELVDRNSELFKESWRALLVENDYFVRTTDDRHERAVQKLISRLHEATTPDGQPVIYPGDYRGLYCLGCEKFLTEKDLTSEGLCPDHLTKPELLSEKNYFFRLTSYLDRVRELIESDRLKILPRERKNEVLGLFKQGLEDFSISREKVRWGIPIPFDPSQKAYVWVDALPNYISAVGFGDDPSAFSKWWRNSHVTHLIGKDILKFHTIFWPAMLLAIGEKVPDLIFIHGYFTVSGQKMSKSLGNVISNHDLVERFGPDAARYLLLNMFPFGTDGDIRISDFYKKYNSDLANDFGNLVSRALKLLESNFAGKIPPASELRGDETALREFIGGAIAKCRAEIDAINPNGAAESFMSVCRELNRYFDSQKPWALAKEKELTRLGTVLRTTLEGIRTVSVLAHPYMPTKCAEIRKTLGLTPQPASISEAAEPFVLHEGFEAKLSSAVFPRLETPPDRDIAAHTAAAPACSDGLIDIAEFGKVQLRVAEILAAEPVPKADKLLKLQIAIGSDRRQIVAGIAQHYKPDQLVGRKIIVVANLKPAKLRGIESNGMLLAAKGGDKLALLTVDFDLPSGATIS